MLLDREFIDRRVQYMQMELRKLGIVEEDHKDLLKEGVRNNLDVIRVPIHRQEYPPLKVEIIFSKTGDKPYRLRWLEASHKVGQFDMTASVDLVMLDMKMRLLDWDAAYADRNERAQTAAVIFALKRLHQYPAASTVAEKLWREHTHVNYPTNALSYPDPEKALKRKQPLTIRDACSYYLTRDYERAKLFLQVANGDQTAKKSGQSKRK